MELCRAFCVCTCRSKESVEDCSPPKKVKTNPIEAGSPNETEEAQTLTVPGGGKGPQRNSSPSGQTSSSTTGGALLGLSAYSDSDSGTDET